MESTFSRWLRDAGEIEKEADYFDIIDIANYPVFSRTPSKSGGATAGGALSSN